VSFIYYLLLGGGGGDGVCILINSLQREKKNDILFLHCECDTG